MPSTKWFFLFVLTSGTLSGCMSVGFPSNSNGKEYTDDPAWPDQEDSPSNDDDDDDDADGVGGPNSELTLPFAEDQVWQLTRAYNEGSHMDYGYDWVDDRYALDFARAGCESWRQPIYPVRAGTVELVAYDEDGYGNYVLIDHGQGYKSRYAHLDEAEVYSGQSVVTQNVIGFCGNTGYVLGSACPEHPGTHLHFAYYLDGEAELPEPLSGHENLTTGCWYGHHGYLDCNGDGQPDNPLGDDDDDSDPASDDDDLSDDDTTADCLDADGDGYGIGGDCLGSDCNDSNSQIHPGAEEQEDAWDNDCDNLIDEGTNSYDDDGDGYSENGGDCDDSSSAIHPGAADLQCDGIDQDCFGGDNCPDPGDDDDIGDDDSEPETACDYIVPQDQPTIQDAINLAVSGETVCVEEGDYHEGLVFAGQDVTVLSLAGPDQTHLYGVGTDSYDAVILADSGESNAATFEGFTLHGSGGRVIELNNSALTLRQLYIDASVGNTGIVVYGGAGATIQNVRIDNPGSYGMTIFGSASNVEVSNLIVTDAGHSGIRAGDSSSFSVSNSVFYNCSCGGVWALDATGEIQNSISVGHSYYGFHLDDSAYSLTVQYSTGYNNTLGFVSGYVTLGPGNSTQDPGFTNPATDLTLAPGSPCLHTGNPDSAFNNPDNTQNSQGAYGGPYGASW